MAQAAIDNDAIIATAMDYFEGWFDGNTERMERALHPDLDKRGVSIDLTGARLSARRTAPQMIGWTRDGEGRAERPADLAIKVRIDDIYEQIATATVYSAVYVEYLQLMQTPQGWRIVNALFIRRSRQARDELCQSSVAAQACTEEVCVPAAELPLPGE